MTELSYFMEVVLVREPPYASEYFLGKPTAYPPDKNSLPQQVEQKFSNSSGGLL